MRFKIIFVLLVFLLAACGQETPQDEEGEREEVSPAVSFSNLDMEVEDLIFRLTGEVKSEEEVIYFHVMQGDETLLGEQEIEIATNDQWMEFEIADELPSEARDGEDAPILTLYGKTEEDREINPNYIPIDIGIR